MIDYYPAKDGSGASARFCKHKDGVLIEIALHGSNDMPAFILRNDDEIAEYKDRFKDAWAAYEGKTPEVSGTPIDQLEGVNELMAIGLKFKGITTIEIFAGMEESQVQALGAGMLTLRKSAIDFLEGAKKKKQEELSKKLEEVTSPNKLKRKQ